VNEWQAEALERFPELEAEINGHRQAGPHGLWNELYLALERAYEKQPIDEDLIRRIYDYALWCFQQPVTADAETDIANATAVGLIENLPLSPRAMDDLHRWMSVETFEGCEALFRYHMSENEYTKFRTEFLRRRSEYKHPSPL
jgi:hypothetical protein